MNVLILILFLIVFSLCGALAIGLIFAVFWSDYHEYKELVSYILFLIAGAFFLEYVIHKLLRKVSSSGPYYFVGALYFAFVIVFMTLLSGLCFYGCPNEPTAFTKNADLLVLLPFLYTGVRLIFLKKSK